MQAAGVRPLPAAPRPRQAQLRSRRGGHHRLRYRQRRRRGRCASRAPLRARRGWVRRRGGRPPGQVPRRGGGGLAAAAARAREPGVPAAHGDGAQVRVPAGAHLAAAGGARHEVGRGRCRRAQRGGAGGARADGDHLHRRGAGARRGWRRGGGRGGARRGPDGGAVVCVGVPLRGQPRRRKGPPLALPHCRRCGADGRVLLHRPRPDLVGPLDEQGKDSKITGDIAISFPIGECR